MPTSIKCHIRGQFGPNKQHLIASDCSPAEQRKAERQHREVFQVHFTFPQNKSECSDLHCIYMGLKHLIKWTMDESSVAKKRCKV